MIEPYTSVLPDGQLMMMPLLFTSWITRLMYLIEGAYESIPYHPSCLVSCVTSKPQNHRSCAEVYTFRRPLIVARPLECWRYTIGHAVVPPLVAVNVLSP